MNAEVIAVDASRRKELLLEYKNRKPEMGVIAFCCEHTQETFFHPSKNTKAEINSHRFRLEMGSHINRALQALWKAHGCRIEVVEVLPYDEEAPDKDYTADLEALCAGYMERTENAKRLLK